MNHVIVIAFNTVRELLRDKLFYNLLIFALLLIGSSILLSRLSIGESQRIIIDLGLASINLVGVAMAILIGITLVSRELDRRTIYIVLTKPVSRASLVLGRYAGLCITLMLNMAVMVVGFLCALWFMAIPITVSLMQPLTTIPLELVVVTAVAVLFSTITTSTLGAMLTCSVYVIGHSLAVLRATGEKMGGSADNILTALTYLLPNLERFNLKSHVLSQHVLPLLDIGLLAGYACAYAACILALAIKVFQRRDLL